MAELFEIVDGKVIVTTSTGWRVECLSYGDDLMRAGSALVFPEKPDPPAYRLGEPEEGEREIWVPYTDESIQDPATPEEDREAWAEYLPKREAYEQEVAAIQGRQTLMRSRVMVYRATKILDLPGLHEWAQERIELYGIPTSGDERELLFQFFTAEVARSPDDVMKLMAGIMRATGVAEEVLDQFEDNFRDTMGTPEGEDAQADQEGTTAATEEKA
jgi:hypothetical protein